MDNHNHLTIHNRRSLKDYFPLIAMILLVLGLTVLSVNTFALDAMTAFMGWFFLVFGALKVIRIHDFVVAYRKYDLLAIRSRTYAYLFPFLELGAGLAYLFSWQIKIVSAIAVPILLISALGVFIKLRQKEEVPCACLGTVFKVPMTYVTLGEDLFMAVMAVMFLM